MIIKTHYIIASLLSGLFSSYFSWKKRRCAFHALNCLLMFFWEFFAFSWIFFVSIITPDYVMDQKHLPLWELIILIAITSVISFFYLLIKSRIREETVKERRITIAGVIGFNLVVYSLYVFAFFHPKVLS